MQLSVCCQPELVVAPARASACVDAARLSDVAGRLITAPRQRSRAHCGCYQSRDVGAYETCAHGCVYCYAVSDHPGAQRRLVQHDPEAEMLRW